MTFIPDTARTLTEGERYDGDTETFLPIAFSHTQGMDAQPSTEVWPTLRSEGGGHAVSVQGGSQQDQFVPLDGVSPTLAHSSNAHMGHHQPKALTGQGVRRLTPVECERLQGFPDDWTAHGPDSRRYAALGDAVTVNVAEWIGRRLMEAAS